MNLTVKTIAVAIVATVASAFVALPAHASVSQGFVAGAGTVTDDWNDEGPISSTEHATSGATGLWQWVLYADGATEKNGTAFDYADIDRSFGPNTTYATKSWQKSHDLPQSGTVDSATFAKAGKNLSVLEDSVPNEEIIDYKGKVHTVTFLRLLDYHGEYEIFNSVCEGNTDPAVYGTPVYVCY